MIKNKTEAKDRSLRKDRRAKLLQKIAEMYPDKKGVVLFCAGFERERVKFHQDSSYYYFVGLHEPADIFLQALEGATSLYKPSYQVDRSVWLPVHNQEAVLKELGINQVFSLGAPLKGYEASPFFSKESLEVLLKALQEVIDSGGYVFTCFEDVMLECKIVLQQLCSFLPNLREKLIGIDSLVGQIRRKKEMQELEYIYRAIEITAEAHETVMESIEPDSKESNIQAVIDYVFAQGQAIQAFTSIVGGGKNGTILHYIDNTDRLESGELVVVDIGASYKHYAADVTRTYPISGTFTKRQKEVYNLVLQAQSLVAQAAKPGVYLNNADFPEESLHHIARTFFEKHNVLEYFPHGIGHFVGLDVHDVGNPKEVLQEGDVITIEPGLYFKEEGIGVRIEDMYWIIEGGAVCLTEGITKDIKQIESIMMAALQDLDDIEEDSEGIH